mmetsp:Transcript_51651/g.121248  ORF Transcript_51651/g.121248 Transcript_51651/m.121248 type:complete len:299 (+) Transcript_51651:161-1057(+)
MSFDFPVPASYFQMKDTLRLWANESGLAAYASSMFGTDSGSPNSRDKSTSDGNSWEQDTFGARIEVVQMHLNLSVKPFVIYGVEDIDRGRELLQQAYRSEPLFQWVLGDLKNDPQAKRKKEAFLEWMLDWKLKNTISYSHMMAIANPATKELAGCALVTYPGSKTEIHQLLSLLKTGSAPPLFLGPAVKARFSALEHMSAARDRLAGQGPHWYIHLLGVGHAEQGQGTGRLMMRIVCALADQDALPVHLQVVGSKNKAFFEKCGFRAMQAMDVTSENAPPLKIHLMTRVPFPKSIELV